ncbi:MAG: hypothetical protein LBT05_04550 [Planctomycetaceae bacterium]|nr:hypothetical protein [Planctomycetaceae bacterium]
MLSEITLQERPILSLISNSFDCWEDAKKSLDLVRKKTETELSQLLATAGTPQAKKEAEASFQQAKNLFAEAEMLFERFQQENQTAVKKFDDARRRCGSLHRTARSIISEGKQSGIQATNTANQAVENARLAKIQFEETRLIIQQKAAEERKQELLRQNAQSCVAAAKNEISSDNVSFISDWMGDEAIQMLREHLNKADKSFNAKEYEQSSLLAQESVTMFRKFYEAAVQMKQNFENREFIADALIDALQEIQYDKPDVNYEPKEGVENAILGNLTIFAKSKGETGDMRLVIDLDGKIDLDTDVPEGKESECHRLLTNLQEKVGDIVDFKMTDWGRAADYHPNAAGGIPKIKIQQQIKQRQA